MGNTLELIDHNYDDVPREKYLVHDYLWDDDDRKLVVTVDTEFVDIIKEIIIDNPNAVCMSQGLFYVVNSETGKYDKAADISLSHSARTSIAEYSESRKTNIYIIIDNLTTGTSYQCKQSTMFGQNFGVKVNISWLISRDSTRTDVVFSI
jgi:hypothetical protein